MKRVGIFIFLVFITISFFNLKKSYAIANKQFTIDYDIFYNISENGETSVKQTTTITNLENDTVPTSYSFTTRQMKIYDITAVTNGKKVEVKQNENGDEITYSAVISNHSVGQGRQNIIDITYKTKSIAVKTGEIWNIFIPGIQIPDTTVLYNVRVAVPQALGPKLFISPTPVIEKNEGSITNYYFTKEVIKEYGINAAFGKHQVLNFSLKYQLENPSILFSKYEIGLPMDIRHIQNISYKNITPKPGNIYQDKDGNILASYILKPKEKLEVIVEGAVQISAEQINPDFGGKFEAIPKELIDSYTKSAKFWEVNSEEIQRTAKDLKDPKLNVIKNARKVYEYVVKNLEYNQNALKEPNIERKGALVALTQRGTWTCMEYTDLFIALSRAMGIPAREINGYAFTNNESDKPLSISLKGGDLLHAWPEFYDPIYGWIQVDPTWGSTSGLDYFTKMDTNHFTLIQRGLDSEYPLPAGAYRFSENDTGKLVEVDFAQTENNNLFNTKLSWQKKFNLNPIQWIKGNNRYLFTNDGNTVIYDLNGQTLFPGDSKIVYMNKKDMTFKYKDNNGLEVERNL